MFYSSDGWMHKLLLLRNIVIHNLLVFLFIFHTLFASTYTAQLEVRHKEMK